MNGIRNLFCNERIILTAIVLNTIILFLGGFWPNSLLFDLSDAAFTLIFVCEAIAKISKYGWKNYWQSGWNKFDFIILLIALPSLAGPFIELSMGTNAILALRSMRLFKSFKMLRFIPNIQKLLKGLKLAVKASLLVLLAFIVMLVIFSILSSTIFGNIMTIGYEKAWLMQAGGNTSVSEIISTYVYKTGLQSAQYSFATAVGLFNSVVNFIILVLANLVAKKTANISIF